MRLLPLLLLLCSCTKNHVELRAILADADAQLASQKSLADGLNDERRSVERDEEELAKILAEFPEEKSSLDDAPLPPPVTPTFAPLPPESMLEGSEGERLRRLIADTRARIVQLSKVTGEVERIKARRVRLERQLAALHERHPPPK